MLVIMKHLNVGTDGIARLFKCLLYIPASSYVRCKNLETSISQLRQLINCLCNSLFIYTQKSFFSTLFLRSPVSFQYTQYFCLYKLGDWAYIKRTEK